jgi:hypothetical protein
MAILGVALALAGCSGGGGGGGGSGGAAAGSGGSASGGRGGGSGGSTAGSGGTTATGGTTGTGGSTATGGTTGTGGSTATGGTTGTGGSAGGGTGGMTGMGGASANGGSGPSNMPGACGFTPGYTGELLGRCKMPCPDGKCGIFVSKGGFLTWDDFEGPPMVWSATSPVGIGINWPARDGRTGGWTSIAPVGHQTMLAVAATDTTGGSPGSKQAIHYSGPASPEWGASLLLPMGSSCYDASAYQGISLWLKGNPGAGNTQVKLNLQTPPTEPALSGGACMTGCYDHFSVILNITPGWTRYRLPWSDFKRQSCTTTVPPTPANFEPQKQILGLSFGQIDPKKGFDFWIDDITFDLDPDSRNTFDKIVTPALFDEFFKTPKAPATYQGLAAAVSKYGTRWAPFVADGTPTQRKHEAAAFLGQITQETGSLIDLVEKVPTMPPYHGRGAIQLTGLANYQGAEAAGFSGIVATPDKVVETADFLFGTAIWFWNTAQSAPMQACHSAIMQGNYGQTTRIINGRECVSPTPPEQANRVKYYREFAAGMGINALSSSLTCQ